jgi:hypothetical protein
LLFNVPRQICHAKIEREQAQQYAKKSIKEGGMGQPRNPLLTLSLEM